MNHLRGAALAAFAYLVLAVPQLQAGVIRSDVADSQYIALGSSSTYASAGKVTFGSNSDWASGVLVAGDWMLTAAHVVNSNFINNTPGNVQFTVGGNTYTGSQIIIGPGYVSGSSENGNDLALVKLSSTVTNVTPMALYTGSSELGEVGTFVGYGKTGTGPTGLNVSSGAQLRGGTNVIDIRGDQFASGWSSNILMSDFDSPTNPAYSSFGSATPTPLEYLPADKDSGSGLFITVGYNTYLAGLVSFALFNTDGIQFGYGDAIAATRISGHAAWIQSQGVPELSSGVMTAFGLGICFVATYLSRRSKQTKMATADVSPNNG